MATTTIVIAIQDIAIQDIAIQDIAIQDMAMADTGADIEVATATNEDRLKKLRENLAKMLAE